MAARTMHLPRHQRSWANETLHLRMRRECVEYGRFPRAGILIFFAGVNYISFSYKTMF
jgi:hypothetical protein